MSFTIGNKLKFTLFGESHGNALGGVLEGLPSGMAIDYTALEALMQRRAPGKSDLTTSRKETDRVEFLSGYFNGHTTGTALAFIIRNADQRSQDYEELHNLPRPSHADYSAWARYGGFEDYRGGGSFSGRLTAPLVVAGGIATQLLAAQNIRIIAHISQVGPWKDRDFLSLEPDLSSLIPLENRLKTSLIPVLDKDIEEKIKGEILQAKEDQDSIGGSIQCAVLGLKPGLGEPWFDSIESSLAKMMFSIPAVKGLEFGRGFDYVNKKGSQVADELMLENGAITHRSNENGGITGGITTSMPVVFRLVIKPTASIGKVQSTVNLSTMREAELKIQGRHDPCIVPRVVPVIEAATALTICDCLMGQEPQRIFDNTLKE